jgi:hypothetical protein
MSVWTKLRPRLRTAILSAALRLLGLVARLRHVLTTLVEGSTGLDAHPPPPLPSAAAPASTPTPASTTTTTGPGDPAWAAPPPTSMLLIAHRGGICLAPENTFAAFRGAWARGAGVELDVRLSRDGRVFVLHDATLRRTCWVSESDRWAKTGLLDTPVEDLDWAAIREVPVGFHEGQPQFPMLLADVLQLALDTPVGAPSAGPKVGRQAL